MSTAAPVPRGRGPSRSIGSGSRPEGRPSVHRSQPTRGTLRPDGRLDVAETEDLLIQLALEHRDLTAVSNDLRRRSREVTLDDLRVATVAIVEHEIAHRLLVHPLLRRDRRGRSVFSERREEQLLLADRLRHVLGDAEPDDDARRRGDPVAGLDHQLVAHADREEIVAFPHVRRVSDQDELDELGGVRRRLRSVVGERLLADDSPAVDGRWATTPRRQLPELLELPDDLVIDLPDLERARSDLSTKA